MFEWIINSELNTQDNNFVTVTERRLSSCYKSVELRDQLIEIQNNIIELQNQQKDNIIQQLQDSLGEALNRSEIKEAALSFFTDFIIYFICYLLLRNTINNVVQNAYDNHTRKKFLKEKTQKHESSALEQLDDKILDIMEKSLPELKEFRCPVTLCLFKNPVITNDGVTYELDAVKSEYRLRGKSPQGTPLTFVAPNHAVRNYLETLLMPAYRKVKLLEELKEKATGNKPKL